MKSIIKKTALRALAALPMLGACADGPAAAEIGNPLGAPETLLASGAQHLSEGDYEKARADYSKLITFPTYECEAN